MTIGERAAPKTRERRWPYWALFGVQTFGVTLICAHGIPLYQQLAGNPASYPTRQDPRFYAFVAIALVQFGYWMRRYLRPTPPQFQSVFLAHLVLFTGRLVWGLATALFGFVFLTQRLAAQMPWPRYLLLITVLFSLFCYLLETLYLGRVLDGRPDPR